MYQFIQIFIQIHFQGFGIIVIIIKVILIMIIVANSATGCDQEHVHSLCVVVIM